MTSRRRGDRRRVEVGSGMQWCVRVSGEKLDFGGFDVNISAVRSRRRGRANRYGWMQLECGRRAARTSAESVGT
jgi:hypothetical protein